MSENLPREHDLTTDINDWIRNLKKPKSSKEVIGWALEFNGSPYMAVQLNQYGVQISKFDDDEDGFMEDKIHVPWVDLDWLLGTLQKAKQKRPGGS